MDVSVIIINYNTIDLTRDCIESIFQHTKGISFEVILVDNASKDGSKEYFSSDNRIIYLYQEVNHGFGKANNIGSKIAKGKYLFLLNSDTVLKNNALLYFYNHYNLHYDKLGCIGGYLIDQDGNPTHSGGTFPTLNVVINSLLRTKPFKHLDYITGADLFLPKSKFESIAGFDEDFFMYYEETYLQYLLYKQAYTNELISGPLIVHLEGRSQNKISNVKRIQICTSLFLFWDKVYSHTRALINKCVFIIFKCGIFFKKGYTYKENKELLTVLIKNLVYDKK